MAEWFPLVHHHIYPFSVGIKTPIERTPPPKIVTPGEK